jgi:hypothetical protein
MSARAPHLDAPARSPPSMLAWQNAAVHSLHTHSNKFPKKIFFKIKPPVLQLAPNPPRSNAFPAYRLCYARPVENHAQITRHMAQTTTRKAVACLRFPVFRFQLSTVDCQPLLFPTRPTALVNSLDSALANVYENKRF